MKVWKHETDCGVRCGKRRKVVFDVISGITGRIGGNPCDVSDIVPDGVFLAALHKMYDKK